MSAPPEYGTDQRSVTEGSDITTECRGYRCRVSVGGDHGDQGDRESDDALARVAMTGHVPARRPAAPRRAREADSGAVADAVPRQRGGASAPGTADPASEGGSASRAATAAAAARAPAGP